MKVNIPNNYRNSSAMYSFEINPHVTLDAGDYMTFTFGGIWDLHASFINIIEGVVKSA